MMMPWVRAYKTRVDDIGRPHLLCSLWVGVLHKGLEALALLKGGNLLDQAKGAEHQVQRVQCHTYVGLQQECRHVKTCSADLRSS